MTTLSTEAVRSERANWRPIFGLSAALGGPVLVTILGRFGLAPSGPVAGAAIMVAILAVVVVCATKVEGGSFASLGVRRPTLGTIGWALLAVVATFVLMGVYYRVVAPIFGFRHFSTPARVDTIRNSSMVMIVFTCLRAGLVEEMLFRFYSISRLVRLFGNVWIASILPLIVFVGLHVPSFGFDLIIPVALGALVLTTLYWIRRDYLCNALAHFLIDFSAFGLAALATYK